MSGRVLKFRVWHPGTGLHEGVELGQGDDGCFSWGYIDDAGVVVEQWTGLVDRNGRDVYEGDVLTSNWDDSEPPLVVVWATAYSGPQWCLLMPNGEVHDFYGGLQADSREVIGNLHQNADKLTTAQLAAAAAANPSTPTA